MEKVSLLCNMEAAADGNLEKLAEMFPEGCDKESVNRRDEDARTALHWACSSKSRQGQQHAECIKLLLSRGANPKTVDDGGWTPLLSASSSGNEEAVGLLLDANVDVNVFEQNSESTPLHLSSAKGHVAVARFLVLRKADVNATDKRKQTPLHRAASTGKHEIIDVLLSAGTKVNTADGEGNTALHLAMEEQHEEASMSLLGGGASVKQKNLEGKTPMELAPESFCGAVMERHG
uniref:26S proteasome non-ATPase regulatory subunit 10 n=2 Tax=Hemiselmis andersenii TaxID=464988 RepID=A0A7S1E910_HEMAN